MLMPAAKVHLRLLTALSFVLLVVVSINVAVLRADDDLDRDLLGDLEADLLDDLNKPAKKDQTQLKQKVGEGEDLGQRGKPDNPLQKIMKQMRSAQSRIAAADASKKTQKIQQDVIADLNLLIEQLQKQCSQCKNPNGQASGAAAKAGNKAARKPGDKPSSDSTDRLDKAKDNKGGALAPAQLVKEVWGHLPARIVDQMSRQSVEKFLPKYEQLIEDYFRRLAEDPNP